MGCWGYYDNTNDDVGDFYCDFINQYENSDDEDCEDEYEYLERQDNIAERFLETNGYEKLKDMLNYNYESHYIPGLCLDLIRLLFNITTRMNCNRIIPDSFPEEVLEYAIKYCKMSLEDTDGIKDFRDPAKRIEALNHEIYIFSRGKEGYRTYIDDV